jgi:hypothetical protein
MLASCKSRRISDKRIEPLPQRVIVKNNKNAGFQAHSIKAALQIIYKGKDNMPNINGSMRMVKDSIIWLNFSKLGFPVAKIRITPEEVRFYEKIGKTYFVGNFDLISSWLGTDFNFDMVQNMFLGETLLDLESQKYKVNVVDGKYELVSKKRNYIFDIRYWIDPEHFKVMKEEVVHPERKELLTILYKGFDKIDESLFPNGFLISVKGEKAMTTIDVTYRNKQFDVPLKFPFDIPSGYRNIELE